MRSIRRSGITALTAAIALALGAIPVALTVPSIVGSGEASTTLTAATELTPGAISAGAVVLTTTSSKGIITYNGAIQEFTGGQQCEVTPIAGGANLLTITGSVGDTQSGTARAGFRDGDIGVFETATSTPDNASQCFRVDAGSTTLEETLTLELPADGPYSDAPFSARLLAESATVDARVGNTRSGSIKIFLQNAIGTWVEQGTPATWSNAKSGTRITFPNLRGSFKGIRLKATSGSFSLRGATFDLVSQADETFCSDGNATNPAGTNEIEVANTLVKYLGNADGGDPTCFGVQLTSFDREVRFLKPLTVAPDAQFLYTITWTLPGSATPGALIAGPRIDFELPLTITEEDFTDLPFCPDSLYTIVNGVRTAGPDIGAYTGTGGFKANTTFIDFDDNDPTDTEKQYACVDTRSAPIVSEDRITVDDTIFVVGDARMTN